MAEKLIGNEAAIHWTRPDVRPSGPVEPHENEDDNRLTGAFFENQHIFECSRKPTGNERALKATIVENK